jgi:hypothetical protein
VSPARFEELLERRRAHRRRALLAARRLDRLAGDAEADDSHEADEASVRTSGSRAQPPPGRPALWGQTNEGDTWVWWGEGFSDAEAVRKSFAQALAAADLKSTRRLFGGFGLPGGPGEVDPAESSEPSSGPQGRRRDPGRET